MKAIFLHYNVHVYMFRGQIQYFYLAFRLVCTCIAHQVLHPLKQPWNFASFLFPCCIIKAKSSHYAIYVNIHVFNHVAQERDSEIYFSLRYLQKSAIRSTTCKEIRKARLCLMPLDTFKLQQRIVDKRTRVCYLPPLISRNCTQGRFNIGQDSSTSSCRVSVLILKWGSGADLPRVFYHFKYFSPV